MSPVLGLHILENAIVNLAPSAQEAAMAQIIRPQVSEGVYMVEPRQRRDLLVDTVPPQPGFSGPAEHSHVNKLAIAWGPANEEAVWLHMFEGEWYSLESRRLVGCYCISICAWVDGHALDLALLTQSRGLLDYTAHVLLCAGARSRRPRVADVSDRHE